MATTHADQATHLFDLESALTDMPDKYVFCRELRHQWKPFDVRYDQKLRCYEQVLRCGQCRTMRIRQIGQSGALLGSKYEYADGYLIKNMGRLDSDDRDMMRLASVMRMMTKHVSVDSDPLPTTPAAKRKADTVKTQPATLNAPTRAKTPSANVSPIRAGMA